MKPIFSIKRWNARSVSEFAMEMADLLDAGIPLLHSLDFVAEQYKGDQKRQIHFIKEKIAQGESMDEAFRSIAFPPIFSSLIGLAQNHGRLSNTFRILGEWFRNRMMFRKKIIQKLSYPFFLLTLLFGLLSYLIIDLLPRFQELLQSFNSDLPPSTAFLFTSLDFVQENIIYILFLLLALLLCTLIAFYWLFKKKKLLAIMLRIPLVQSILQIRYTYFFASQLGLLLEGGMGFWDALASIRTHSPYRLIEQPLREIESHILSGQPLSCLQLNSPLFQKEFYRFVSLGEAQGTIGFHLIICAQRMEQKIEQRTRYIMMWLEPTILVLLGIFIGFVVLSLFIPIFQLLQVI